MSKGKVSESMETCHRSRRQAEAKWSNQQDVDLLHAVGLEILPDQESQIARLIFPQVNRVPIGKIIWIPPGLVGLIPRSPGMEMPLIQGFCGFRVSVTDLPAASK
jgi:hypothetical protein